MKIFFWALPISLLLLLVGANLAAAHAVVKPNQVGIGAFQTFSLGVPSEKPLATIGIRLMIPAGLNFVTPNVKPGWKVEVKKTATGKKVKDDDGMMVDEMLPTEIDWTGGSIPDGQRDEFAFSVQVPSQPTDLPWKVYQTYADNSVISWDQDPTAAQPKDASGNPDFSKVGPYSVSKVVDDLSTNNNSSSTDGQAAAAKKSSMAITLSVIALALAIIAFLRPRP